MFRQFSRMVFSGMAFLVLLGISNFSAPALFAQATPIEPVKSFPDIPTLAKSSAEVKARYGPITDSDGKPDKGDKLTQKVNKSEMQWMKDFTSQAKAQESQYVAQAMNPYGAGAMNPNTGRVLGLLQTTTVKLQGEERKIMQAYRDAEAKIEDKYKQQLAQIPSNYSPKMESAGCDDPHPRPTQTECKPLANQWRAAILKSGDTYLSNLATPFGEMRTKMKGVAAEAQSVLDQADKTLGANRPLFVQGLYRGVVMAGITALGETNSAENDAVVLVYKKSVSDAALLKMGAW